MASDVYTPSEEDRPQRVTDDYPGWLGLLVSGVYVLLSMAWIVMVSVGAVAIVLAGGALSGDIEAMFASDQLPTAALAGLTIVQFGGWLLIAAGLAAATGRTQRQAFALKTPHVGALAAAVLGGLTVGIFPGKLAEALQEAFPQISMGNLGTIQLALAEGPLAPRLLMMVAVVIAAPLVEELVFRGFLFDTLGKALPVPVVWVLTSLLFAAYHMDPPHVIAVILIGLFLGWLRVVSGSIVPSMIAHAVNNGLATGMALFFGGQELAEATLPWSAATAALVVTTGFASLALIGRPKPPAA
jgi:membrane protease YdiL (CAAX protease family)